MYLTRKFWPKIRGVWQLFNRHCKDITNKYGTQKYPKLHASFGIHPKNILGTQPKTQHLSVDFILSTIPLSTHWDTTRPTH